MTTSLLDSNLVIALAVVEHQHYGVAEHWFAARQAPFATCPITEGALVRHVMRAGRPMTAALTFLQGLAQRDEHEFWPDDVPFHQVPVQGVIGHRQVTDAYLAQLARFHNGRVATLDTGFAALHPDVTDLVPIKEQA